MKMLYILFSKSAGQYYVGITSNFEERIAKHQNGSYKNAFTKKAND
ncbi:GIY-YIG nuclease family protein [Galbibacter mesophilus]|nr:GIY-YIG nuclease family protein [Galbibacter mesophilus]MCM5662620.1 GIY-YIG nuclease family protein [Galbibacter mesophilus]